MFFICDKTFVTTSILLLWQKTCFVTTKTILEAAPTSDNLQEWNRKKKDTLFTNEEQTKVGSWCIWYFATHFGLVYDVDCAECWAQNGSNQNTRNWKTAICLCYSVEYGPVTLTGFIQKNPSKIHKLFKNLCDTAQKSNMKVLNSSTHQVKGCNPYYSWWPCILPVKTDRKCVLCDFAQLFFFLFKKKKNLTTAQSWEM